MNTSRRLFPVFAQLLKQTITSFKKTRLRFFYSSDSRSITNGSSNTIQESICIWLLRFMGKHDLHTGLKPLRPASIMLKGILPLLRRNLMTKRVDLFTCKQGVCWERYKAKQDLNAGWIANFHYAKDSLKTRILRFKAIHDSEVVAGDQGSCKANLAIDVDSQNV
ncbi:hypothetical protein [Parasitella parasitica]|uniref:Uncharacterized protein n=1 Tax=Parasitella parasitica TaxID=35722 RepID=A0A0B7NEQ4_9FUNG|nr:hypothetical protein [Parasitella parasitica]